jgi:membrane-bound serine protease (ClpP class)
VSECRPGKGSNRRGIAVLVLCVLGAPLILGTWMSATAARAQSNTVLVTEVQGVITPVMADHVAEGLTRAEQGGHAAFVVELDTPGGLDASMREIIQEFLASDVPVVVHVAPSGARAASAGALITMAAHVAAMAPGTSIGAATPVDLEGGDLAQKVIEDAAAYAESVARARGRNTEFAAEAVREGRSVAADEARRIGVVDLLAGDRRALLEGIDGTTVTIGSGVDVVLETDDAGVVLHDLGMFRSVLQWLANPNLAFLFMSLGMLALVYELASPGIGGGAIVGVILILLALFGLAILPVNALGGLLLLLAGILFAVEVFTPGVGVGAAGGTVSLVLGGLFLFRGRVGVDPRMLVPVAIVVGVGSIFAGRLAWRTRRLTATTGAGGLLGAVADVHSVSGPTTGQAFVQGAWWNVRTAGAPLQDGATVRVVDVQDLDLLVEIDRTRMEGGPPQGKEREDA